MNLGIDTVDHGLRVSCVACRGPVRKTGQRTTLRNSLFGKSILPRILRKDFETLAFQNLVSGPHSGLQRDSADNSEVDNP